MVPFRQRRAGFSQLVVRREYPVVAMPVLPRRRDEIHQTVEEVKRGSQGGPQLGGKLLHDPPLHRGLCDDAVECHAPQRPWGFGRIGRVDEHRVGSSLGERLLRPMDRLRG
jgi:hypothetical protein